MRLIKGEFRREPDETYTNEEISLALNILARLDPDRYPAERAKSLIYKTRASLERAGDGILSIRIVR